MPLKTAPVVVGVLLMPLALAACSSSSSSGTASPSTGAHASANPDAGIPTGATLKQLLLPVSVLPKGYKAQPSYTRDTGTTMEAPTSAPATTDCTKLETTSWIGLTNVGPASFAQADFENSYQEEYNEEIDAFRGGDAQTVMSRIKNLVTKCATFKDNSGGTAATFTVKTTTVPALGDDSFEVVVTSPAYQGGQTVVVSRVGNEVITSFYNVQSGDLGAPALGFDKTLVANVKAKATS